MDQPPFVFGDEETAVRNVIASALGAEPENLQRMTFGHMSRTYQATLPDGQQAIVRTNTAPETFATTSGNIETLRGLGLPVPRILTSDLTLHRYPFAYMIMESIPGRDLRYELAEMSRSQMTALAGQLVHYQRKVGALPLGEGFGYVGIGQKGPQASWWDFLFFDPSENPPIDETQRRWRAEVAHLIRQHELYLRAVPATCFLDDVTVKNVIILQGELQGLIDFDCVCYGDPLWWIGLTAAGVISDVGSKELLYVDELCQLYGLSHEQGQIVPLYCAMHAIGFVGRSEGSEGAAWMERMHTQIERWLVDSSASAEGI